MNSLTLVLAAFGAYILAYRLYGRYLGRKIFQLADTNRMPSHTLADGVDFIPSRKHVVLGHHFTTIAGLGPIVGPAIGIIWGWLPAFLWVIFGSILVGGLHDFSAMVISARHQGKTIGELTGELISPSTRLAFQVLIQFLLWIVVSIFALIMSILLMMYPQSVLPVMMEIPLALWLGSRIRQGKGDVGASLLAVALLFVCIGLGQYLPITLPPLFGSPVISWTIFLFGYVFVASTLPIDRLLQPRDYINSHQLLIIMALMALGVVVANPEISAPAINPAATAAGSDIPAMLPLLFITIACGAVSGFHSLASSGTSVKQIAREHDMLTIGYGGMMLEGLLAVIVIAAVAGGLGMGLEKDGVLYTGSAAFHQHYASWASSQGLAPKIEAVVTGAANLMSSFGMPLEFGRTIMAVFIVSFAGTTLDSATRIQRLSLQELCRNRHGMVARPIKNRYSATLLVVIMAAVLTFLKPGAKGALILWPLFGALNQLLAALGLCVATVYLARKGRNILVAFLPMLFMLGVTVWAMILNLRQYLIASDTVLTALSLVIFVVTGWIMVSALKTFKNFWNGVEAGQLLEESGTHSSQANT
jgi:carbon starvation protein